MAPKEQDKSKIEEKERRFLLWAVVVLGKLLLAGGLWQLQKMNNNIEGLTHSVIEVGSEVKRINDKMIYVDERLNKHDAKFERWESEFKNFYDTYDLKKKK